MPKTYFSLASRLDTLLGQITLSLSTDYPDAPAVAAQLRDYWLGTYQNATVSSLTDSLSRWCAWLRQPTCSGPPLAAASLAAYIGVMEADKLSARSVSRYLTGAHAFLEALVPGDEEAAGQIARVRVGANRLATANRHKGHIMALLDRTRLEALSAAADPSDVKDTRTVALAWICYDTLLPADRIFGQGVGEDWAVSPLLDTSLAGDELFVPATALEPATVRRLSATTMTWLTRYRHLRGPAGPLFTNRFGHPLRRRGWADDLIVLKRVAGMDDLWIGFESCRRGGVRDRLEAGACIADICLLAGWRTAMPLLRICNASQRLTARVHSSGQRLTQVSPRLQEANQARLQRQRVPAGVAAATYPLFASRRA